MLEVGNGLSSVRNRSMAIGLKKRFDIIARYELVELHSDLYEQAWKLFEDRSDKDWGIVDCISFVLMEQRGITDALTADKHFEQAGFTKLLKSFG